MQSLTCLQSCFCFTASSSGQCLPSQLGCTVHPTSPTFTSLQPQSTPQTVKNLPSAWPAGGLFLTEPSPLQQHPLTQPWGALPLRFHFAADSSSPIQQGREEMAGEGPRSCKTGAGKEVPSLHGLFCSWHASSRATETSVQGNQFICKVGPGLRHSWAGGLCPFPGMMLLSGSCKGGEGKQGTKYTLGGLGCWAKVLVTINYLWLASSIPGETWLLGAVCRWG